MPTFHRIRFLFISVMIVTFFTASCIKPPKYSSSVIEIGTTAPTEYANITLGLISTANTEQSKKYLLDLQREVESGIR